MANTKYDPELRKKVLHLHLKEGRTIKSLTAEYQLGKGTISYWLKRYREECESNDELKKESDDLQELRRLKDKVDALEKENRFLKKAAAFFAKETE